MKKIVLGASTALAAMTFLGAPAAAQMPGSMPTQPPAPVVVADGTGMSPVEQMGGFRTLTGTGAGRVETATRVYTEASYLLMFASDGKSQTPIATGGPSNGVIGRPGTTQLLDTSTSYNTLSGFKVGVGGLIGATSLGFEVNAMVFGRTSDGTTLGPTSTPLARPFFDTVAKRESSIVIASPGAFTGALDVKSSLTAWGAEANPFFRLVQGNTVNFDLITGFRYFAANERFDAFDARTVQAGGVTAFNGIGVGNGASLLVQDRISARNQFYGANIGGRIGYSSGPWFIDATAKVAIGGVHQIVTLDGTTTLVSGGGLVGPATTPGGFLTNVANGGRTSENRFAVLPEANIQLGYQLTSWANVFAGYQVLYLSNMARAGDQVDRNINPNRLPTVNTFNTRGLMSTAATTDSGDLFLHGFNFGFTLTY